MVLTKKHQGGVTLMNIVSLLEVLVNGLLETEEKFFENPKDIYTLEKATKATTDIPL